MSTRSVVTRLVEEAPDRKVVCAPAARAPHPALAQARATTHRVARTFSLACRLLPRAVRDDVYLLYLVFRTLDDLVDERRPEARARVDAVCAWAEGDGPPRGTPEVSVLASLCRRHELPASAFVAFCEGMRTDLEGPDFASEGDLDRYCYRVAGTVGEVMAAILGVRDRAVALPAAAALGMAMQRTNILRDIDEDAAAGRRYLARETVASLGGTGPGEREALLRDQIERTDRLYERGLAGVGQLRGGRAAVAAAAAMYREILRQIEREGYGVRAGRAAVTPARKAIVALPAAWRA